jgi:hypothetical protein
MKKNLRKSFKPGLFVAAAMLVIQFCSVSFAATFTAVASGNWSSSVTWGGAIPAVNNLIDQVTIPEGITVTMDSDMTLNGITSQINVMGTLNSTPGRSFNVIIGSLSGSGTIVTHHIEFGTGATLFFSGTLNTNIFRTTAAGLQSSANMMINDQLELTAGTMSIQSGGTLSLASGATIHRSGGQLILNGGNLNLGSNYHVRYSSANTTGIEISGSGLKDVTIDPGAGNTVYLNSYLIVAGTLTMSSGTMDLNTNNLMISGNVAASGTGNISSTDDSNISIATTSSLSGSLRFHPSSHEVNNFVVNVGNGNQASFSGTLNVRGILSLASGALWLNAGELHIMGSIATGGSGSISSTSASNSRIRITTSASPGGVIRFTAGSNTLDDFEVNIANSGSITVASDLNVDGTLNLTAGYISMGNNMLTVGTAGIINGGSSSAHVKLGATGSLNRQAVIVTGVLYPIGTGTAYLPAKVTLNAGSSTGMIRVGVRSNVYANGLSGIDISATQAMVDATWDVASSITSNLNMDLEVMWSAAAEVNGFNRNVSYISHYTDNAWDLSTTGTATTLSGGMYSRTRTNIASLSPFAVFDASTTLSTKELNELAIEVYPNPTNDKILFSNVDFAKGPLSVDIINIYGQSVASYELTESNSYIPVNQLPKGNYYIQLNSNYIHSVKQFTKN